MRLLLFCTCILIGSPLAWAQAVELGAGYSLLDLKNPNTSSARSTGLGLGLGAYYSIFSNDFFDVGLKASGFYANLKNDVSTEFLREETEHYSLGAGLEVSVYQFFASWQSKYNRLDIQLHGNLQNTSAFSDYMSQWEVGYIFPMESMSIRFVFQYVKGELPQLETGLSSNSDFSSSSLMVMLRFNLQSSRSESRTTYEGQYKPESKDNKEPPEYTPGNRTYRYTPKPSRQIRY